MLAFEFFSSYISFVNKLKKKKNKNINRINDCHLLFFYKIVANLLYYYWYDYSCCDETAS